GFAGSTRLSSRSRNAPARSSLSLAPVARSYTSLSTTASSTPAPARSTTRATSRPTGCTASFALLDWTVPSRTGIGRSTPPWSPVSRGEMGTGGEDGEIRPSEGRDDRVRDGTNNGVVTGGHRMVVWDAGSVAERHWR